MLGRDHPVSGSRYLRAIARRVAAGQENGACAALLDAVRKKYALVAVT